MGIYKGFLSFLLLLWFNIPLGINAVMVNKKPLIESNLENELLVPEMLLKQTHDELYQTLEKYRFNGTALIALKGKIIFKEAMGLANFKNKAPITLDSHFQLASASKPFTALSIMLLKERGLLHYDDFVCSYLPTFPYQNITIRHLLNHTSGLQNYMYLVDNYWKQDRPINNQDMLGLLISHFLPLNNIPGNRFNYCNTGYAVLPLVVETITKQKFRDFLQVEIFDKCSMNNTFMYNRKLIEQDLNAVIGYHSNGRSLRPYPYDPNNEILGDKSVYSTVQDLYKFEMALNNYEIVDKETLNEAYSKAILQNQKSVNYGFGWRFKEEENHSYIYHNGLWHGFASTITFEPADNITIVLLNNTSTSMVAIKRDLLGILHSKFDTYIN